MPKSRQHLLKFCGPTEYSLSNLERGVIYCQHYSAYNDPFEFWTNTHEGIPDAQAEPERFLAAKKAWGAEWMSADDEYLTGFFEACREEQPLFKQWRDRTRIACFGSEPDNLLMWSHYADGLRGFCIVFDDAEVLEASPRSAFAVNVAYLDAPPTADAFVYAISNTQVDYHLMAIEEAESRAKHLHENDPWVDSYKDVLSEAMLGTREILQVVFATKPLEWKYEAERRLLVQASANSRDPIFHPYPKTAIREVLIGERMPKVYRDSLEAILAKNYRHVPVRTVKRSPSRYRLEIE